MALKTYVEPICRFCGGKRDIKLHDDGSVRSEYHNCDKQPPGPPDFPRMYRKGEMHLKPQER